VSWPDDDIEELVKGERPTLLEAEKGNEVIEALNVLGNMTIESGHMNDVQYSADGVKIIYDPSVPYGMDEDVYVLKADDPSIKLKLVFSDGTLLGVFEEASEWVEKEITICEDGSPATYTFLVKA
tara:strand:+ start:1095 stop:1469 length:375 start_codon:yes stop_codon:yes gene_type:complete